MSELLTLIESFKKVGLTIENAIVEAKAEIDRASAERDRASAERERERECNLIVFLILIL
jgi:hypothetical protein